MSKKQRAIELLGDAKGGVHQADVRIGLRKVTPLAAGHRIHILAEQSQLIGVGEQLFESRDRLTQAVGDRQSLHIPKSADQESGLWLAKVVLMSVTKKQPGFSDTQFF